MFGRVFLALLMPTQLVFGRFLEKHTVGKQYITCSHREAEQQTFIANKTMFL